MQAILHSVERRSEVSLASYAAATDFVRGPAESTSALRVLEEPGWSPYCIDLSLAELVFVRLPAATNLAHALSITSLSSTKLMQSSDFRLLKLRVSRNSCLVPPRSSSSQWAVAVRPWSATR